MKNNTVKKRIFKSNAWMVFVTLVIFLIINLVIIKIYSEAIEEELRSPTQQIITEDELEGLLESWTIHRNEFLVLFAVDGVLCIIVLVIISQLFTKKLTGYIMEPLEALAAGANRIRANELTQDIEYSGDEEFENVCEAFNEMQRHILTEQEKNRRYEKSRTDMIAGISHDLRTPLTAIKGTIKGLMDGVAATPEQQERFLQAAYRRTGDMDVLLNQLFYLSRMETGGIPLSVQTIEISEFIRNYTGSKQELLDGDKETLTADTGTLTAKVSVDPEQLQRVLDNLMENSRKYAEKTPLRMQVSLSRAPKGICISFADNGVGAPEEKLPYLFDEFYRGDESRNKKEGNGLGLYIVKCLIQAMGGSVKAENREGLVIRIELPLAKGKEETAYGEKNTNR